MKSECIPLNWVEGLSQPCADIYASYGKSGSLEVEMKFSLAINGYPNDVQLIFENPISFIWENESYSQLDIPDKLPMCKENFSNWVFPFIEISNSNWKEQYEGLAEAYSGGKTLKQFALISMNDLFCVLTTEDPIVKILNEIA